jgi:hypothetical protein
MALLVPFDHVSALPFSEEESVDGDVPDYDDGDDAEDDFYIPSWMGRSYGFRDLGRLQEEKVVALIETHLPSDVVEWDYLENQSWLFRYPEADVRLITSSDSPSFFLPVEVINRNYTLERTVIDPLRHGLRNIISQEGPKLTCFYEFALLVLRVLDEASACLRIWRGEEIVNSSGKGWRAWQPDQVRSWEEVLDNPVGVDLASIKDTAHHILGKTPEQICAKLPEKIRVLHVESVLRSDLVDRFFECRARMRQRLRTRPKAELLRCIAHNSLADKEKEDKEEMVEWLTTPRLTFHGTRRNFIHSIVRYGFAKPGGKIGDTGAELNVRCGSTYGRGIYSSPDPGFSLSYSGYGGTPTKRSEIASMKLIVCATLMGRTASVTREDNWRSYDEAMPNADSHVANREYEYIVFDEAQIVPCYVIHLDWGAEQARRFLEDVPDDPETWIERHRNKTHPKLVQKVMYAGDIEREKAAKQAAAAKWFPYGYGPAKGTRFVIEEIGETSDDEENYGEYQDAKVEADMKRRERSQEHKKLNDEVKIGKLSIFDEFFEAARTNRQQKVRLEEG